MGCISRLPTAKNAILINQIYAGNIRLKQMVLSIRVKPVSCIGQNTITANSVIVELNSVVCLILSSGL